MSNFLYKKGCKTMLSMAVKILILILLIHTKRISFSNMMCVMRPINLLVIIYSKQIPPEIPLVAAAPNTR